MDFIEALPCVNNKTTILIVVDRLSKAAHFIHLGHPYIATSNAQALFDEVVRLHSLPSSIVSDRDPVFTKKLMAGAVSHVWNEAADEFSISLSE
jgi:hypothetical protein